MSSERNTKIRIRLESFNHEVLDSACKTFLSLFQNISINSFSIVPLPTNKRIYCVLRSPHVDKDSREHFEVRVHKRIIDIYYDSNFDIFELLTDVNLPSGVLCKVNLGS